MADSKLATTRLDRRADRKKVSRDTTVATASPTAAADAKAHLQREIEKTRGSISQTVGEIKETVEEQYATVKATVSGILDWREQFQKDPIVLSVGALAAGFALGYTLRSAQGRMNARDRRRSQVAAFADGLVEELAAIGKTLPPALDARVKQSLGFGVSDLLTEIGTAKKPRKAKRSRSKKAKKPGRRQARR